MEITNVNAYATTAYEVKANSKPVEDPQKETNESAAVYEKGSSTEEKAKTYKTDTDTINRLKRDLEYRQAQLKSMVVKMLSKQGLKYEDVLKGTPFEIDEETRKQAEADIGENGYWGVEQTSDRLVEFAKALTGSDPALAAKMRDAIKEGFKQAEAQWGGKLPDLCQKTYDATMKKLDEWEKGQA